MTNYIAGLIKEELDYEWIESYGATYPGTFTMSNTGDKKYVLPFEFGVEECTNDKAIYPKDKVGCLSFIEVGPASPGLRMEGVNAQDQEYKIIFMLNVDYLNPNDPLILEKVRQAVTDKLKRLLASDDNVEINRTTIIRTSNDARQILAKYSFEDKFKNNIVPRFTFAIDLRVSYMSKLCNAEIEIQPKC